MLPSTALRPVAMPSVAVNLNGISFITWPIGSRNRKASSKGLTFEFGRRLISAGSPLPHKNAFVDPLAVNVPGVLNSMLLPSRVTELCPAISSIFV